MQATAWMLVSTALVLLMTPALQGMIVTEVRGHGRQKGHTAV
jgi:ammonia channel protein AmtB